MENIVTVRVHAKEVKNDNQKFISCSAEFCGEWYKIKFVQTCKDKIEEKGIYDLTLDLGDCSIEKGKPYTSKSGITGISNPTIWVRSIVEARKYTKEELKALNAEKNSAILKING